MKKILASVALLFSFTALLAQTTARNEIYADLHRSASNYYAYPEPNAKLTTPPSGYKPFYISTYARHGSRYLIDPADYTSPLTTLKDADKLGKLTALGKQVLKMVDSINFLSKDRLGELTPLGARQHQGIAARMFKNYPEVFASNTLIDARSTIVIRCILSMTAECLQLQALNPKLRFKNDASQYDMYYMNYKDDELIKLQSSTQVVAAREDLDKKYIHPERLMQTLFNDVDYVSKNVKANKLMTSLFDIAGNMQSHDISLDLYPIFTKEECYDLWLRNNLTWYMRFGASPVTQSKMPYMEANLLENILNTADTSIVKQETSATLRFGHETCLLPLAALLELGNSGKVINNLDDVTAVWRNYQIFPMASNIQFVFFRKPGNADVLVKVLLNESEVSLPVKTTSAPFYLWKDVEAYYRQKLAAYKQSK